VDELKSSGKPFEISKRAVWEAFEKVKANKGAPGVDAVSIEEFEEDLKGNLYKIWNRMSSGTYFPPAVRAVEIPKPHGKGTRMLGVPTVADRIAQTVVAGELERKVEPIFHADSYGYRPGRSALDAVEADESVQVDDAAGLHLGDLGEGGAPPVPLERLVGLEQGAAPQLADVGVPHDLAGVVVAVQAKRLPHHRIPLFVPQGAEKGAAVRAGLPIAAGAAGAGWWSRPARVECTGPNDGAVAVRKTHGCSRTLAGTVLPPTRPALISW
jgi:hypothetical protein